MQGRNKIKNSIQFALMAGCAAVTVFFPKVLGRRGYYMAAFVFALLATGAVFLTIENSKPNSLKMAVIAVMCALGIAGRAVFAGVPFVKPVAAIVTLTGVCLGPQRGFLRGAVTMLISNFMFSQGPWTLWQMLGFGMLGFLAGLIFYKRKKLQKPAVIAICGTVFYILITGPILDLSGIFAYSIGGKASLGATLLAGLPVNISSGVATGVFLLLLAKPIISKLNRIIVKYGL